MRFDISIVLEFRYPAIKSLNVCYRSKILGPGYLIFYDPKFRDPAVMRFDISIVTQFRYPAIKSLNVCYRSTI